MKYTERPEYKLFKALKLGDLAQVGELTQSGADIHRVTESEQWTYLHKMFTSLSAEPEDRSSPASVQFLIEQGLDVNAIDSYGNTPLIYAVRQKNLAGMRLLLTNGADRLIGHWNIEGVDALKMALQGNPLAYDMVKLLLDFGADPDAKKDGVRSVREVLQIFVGIVPEVRELIGQYTSGE
ncbi:Ankyrin repeats (3 copies) [Vibrio aerogenes CECT 7868]|uniref:Ankyrin repeats (3 copies) n=1 Tax=Vibrio aerogenes CECT 7868 TaxID=1216006 RepID=A0A1M5X293_9VIBR|nr:ankyrin repeat domain-containing protein [Vibrio aerogenes]SHH93891.1 Ankyrin repeats (3 copies) [Vibrio aerogenes CECT 7868]